MNVEVMLDIAEATLVTCRDFRCYGGQWMVLLDMCPVEAARSERRFCDGRTCRLQQHIG